MFIPRDLNIHVCNDCQERLIDSNFERCGIHLQGEHKWQVFFEYKCPHCGYSGQYLFESGKSDVPGNLFRQFGDAVDNSYMADAELNENFTEPIDGLDGLSFDF